MDIKTKYKHVKILKRVTSENLIFKEIWSNHWNAIVFVTKLF
jgi:hypothetical protein